jgi:hypothetical protein
MKNVSCKKDCRFYSELPEQETVALTAHRLLNNEVVSNKYYKYLYHRHKRGVCY